MTKLRPPLLERAKKTCLGRMGTHRVRVRGHLHGVGHNRSTLGRLRRFGPIDAPHIFERAGADRLTAVTWRARLWNVGALEGPLLQSDIETEEHDS